MFELNVVLMTSESDIILKNDFSKMIHLNIQFFSQYFYGFILKNIFKYLVILEFDLVLWVRHKYNHILPSAYHNVTEIFTK